MERQERDELLSRLRRDAHLIAQQFNLSYREIVAEHPRVKSRYGVCYEDGLIKIRLNHAKTGDPLKYSSLIDTLCHELAHLRHFNHGPEFKDFFFRLLGWARRQGIYKPGPAQGGRRPPHRLPPSVVGKPPQRNGVPVFPTLETDVALELPWMTGSKPEAPTPRSAPPAPAPPKPAARQRPEQLSLF